MANELKFALYAIRKNLQGSAELRTSFVMNIIGMAINNLSFMALWLFFVQSVGVIGGWRSVDVIGLEGFVAISFGLIRSVGAGIHEIDEYVASGAFDRYMLSPKDLLLRVATSTFDPSALGDLIYGAICLVLYAVLLPAGFAQLMFLLALIPMAALVFLSAMILVFSASFYFADATAITDGLFEIFFTPSMFHGGAFQGAMRTFFTFIIPSLLIGTLPVEAVRDLSIEKFLIIAGFSIFWYWVSLIVFGRAVRRYESANLTTFGK